MGAIARVCGSLWRALGEALFPRCCAGCRCLLAPGRVDAPGDIDAPGSASVAYGAALRRYWCDACGRTLMVPNAPLCPRCGVMLPQEDDHDHLCGDCLTGSGHFLRARAFGIYQDALMAAVHQLKYKARLSLATPLGHMLCAAFRRHGMERTVDLVLPVPLHLDRLRQRGFNQVKLMLDAWEAHARRCGAYDPIFVGTKEVLVRVRATPPQTGQKRRARRRNMRGAFAVRDAPRIQARRVLLVDDVYTTGATVEEASRCLMQAGARSVEVLTLARTMPWRSNTGSWRRPSTAVSKGNRGG
jgi:ComF family protein